MSAALRSIVFVLLAVQLYARNTPEHSRTLEDAPENILPAKTQAPDGEEYYLVGDMLLTADQVEADLQRKMVKPYNYWPRNKDTNVLELRYAYDTKPKYAVSKDFKRALEIWMEQTCMVFKEVPLPADEAAEKAVPYVFLKLTAWGGCTSLVGWRKTTGPQLVNAGVNCGLSTTLHEVGHAMGFQHEQTRSGRDKYVTIFPDAVKEKFRNSYEKKVTFNYDVPYDYTSIMHYSDGAFGIGDAPTMKATDARFQKIMGRKRWSELSFMDAKIFNIAYKCTDDWKAACKGDPCKNGGYIKQTKGACACVCPEGTAGANCEKLNMSYNDAIYEKFKG